MGLLSKIFDTDKLEYILREEEEFSVTAPQSWNVETLTVGDTITPDMFKDQYRFYDFDLYIKEIGYDDEYEHDDIEGSHYVTTEFDNSEKKYLHNQHTWWFHEINDYLKPEYKVVTTDLSESEDEFTVDAPENWNVEMLTVGDTIEPNMWIPLKDLRKQLSSETREYVKYFQSEPRVIKKIFYDNDDQRLYFYIEDSDAEWTNNLLKPQYKVTEGLKESDDEFNVTAPEEWNIQILYDGDLITPDMWNREKLVLKNYIYDPNQDWTIIAEEDPNYVILNSKGGVKIGFTKDTVNSLLKPEYKISLPNLNESDEFTVTAPQNWNIEMLTVGDTITPDMLKPNNEIHDSQENLYITKIGRYTDGLAAILRNSKGERNLHYLENINNALKPQYKIYTYLKESDEDFSVEAPSEWDVTELKVGDFITPDMIQDQIHDKFTLLKGENGKLGFKILDIKDSDDGAMVRLQMLNSPRLPIYWNIKTINDKYLKPQYKVIPNSFDINESEDEFSVEAPKQWNVETLTVGDTITPDMWNKQKFINDGWFGEEGWFGLEAYNKTIQDSYLIQSMFFDEGDEDFEADWQVNLNSTTTGKSFNIIGDSTPLKILNSLLKDNYKVYSPEINESEDEFSVDAPQSWDVIDLGVGDYIAPEMINVPKNKRQWDNFHHIFADPKRAPGWKINKFFFTSERGVYVRLEYRGNWHDFRVDFVNEYLKPQFKISPSSFNINESEEEDFNVIAPDEWNQEYLTAGDTITPDMWNVSKLVTPLKYYFKKPVEISWIGYSEFDDEEEELLVNINLGSKYMDFDIYHVNDLLKPLYKIVQNKALTEEEEEFNVDAPTEWNYELLTIGDTITPDMWDDDVTNLSSIKQFNHVLKKPFTIKGISRSDLGGGVYYSIQLDDDTYIHSSFLKPQYQITPNLSENDDEFTVDAPESWNVTELGIGSILDPSNLKMQDHSKKYEIVDFGVTLFPWEDKTVKVKVFELVEEPIPGTRRTTRQWKHTRNSSIDLDTLKRRLKDNYKIISTLNESDDDEFTVKAPKGWDVTYLRVGDTITPNMWNKREIKQVTSDISFDEPLKIKWIGTDGFDGFIEFEGYDSDYLNVEFIHDILKPKYRISLSNINESDDEFNVDAPEDWNVQYLGVGDTIQGKMWNWENIITWCNRVAGDNNVELNELIRRWEDVYDEGATIDRIVKYGDYHHVEFDSDSGFLRFGPNVSTVNNWLSDGYEIEKSLTEEAEDFNVIASPKWDIIELGVGDYINSNMLNPKSNDYTWFSRRKLFIEDIYFDECWTVNLLHVESNYHTQFCIDYINEDVLNDKYKIMNSLNELSKLLEVDDEFSVDAPKEWNVQELGIGDKITRDMIKNPVFLDQMDEDFRMDFPGVITNMYRAGVPGDEYWGVRIKFQDVGWRKYLPKSKDIKLGLGFTLDGFNQNTLKPQYQIQKPVFELSSLLENEEDFNVNAPDEWNVELLTVGDTITPDMWGYDGIFFDVSKPLTIEDIGEDEGGWWIQLGRSEAPFDLDEINEYLKSKYRVVPYILEESDDEFSVNAPEEWNITQLGVNDIITPDMWTEKIYKITKSFIINKIASYGFLENQWEVYMRPYGSEFSQNNTSDDQVINLDILNNYLKPEYKITKNKALFEEEDEFNVSAPEEWWEYDGDVEIMFQDTYWYEDENGKEAIVERDGGGILNINDLEQYSYSGWKPFTGNPTNENLKNWWYSINWDTDLIEIFSFDDSIFEVEEDFEWSTADNIDMDRTGFRIRAVSTLNESDDEFTVKPSKKWDIVYLNKGDFLDNTNSTFNDPNVKYEIGNITSGGEIEVKKYINRGGNFEPQFDRFMKTRKGIVKAKLKPGFDIETSSK
jgi:hypothetical protein